MHNWDSRDPELSGLRSSGRWKKARKRFLLEHPICEICASRASVEVHHVHLATIENFFDEHNFAALCVVCHQKAHSAMRRGIDMSIFFGNRW